MTLIEAPPVFDSALAPISQDVIRMTALIISETPYSQSDFDNYVAAEWYHRTKYTLIATNNTELSEGIDYLREIERTAQKLAESTPNIPEVIHFLAARSVVDYKRSQIGFKPLAARSLKVTP